MRHARQHSENRIDLRRSSLAHEAARLIAESGIVDYHLAKRKAAATLDIHDEALLPQNHEIEAALRQYQRLFSGPNHAGLLDKLRQSALQAMEFFAQFSPRLVGPVLDGTADARSPVQLHLHSDDEEAIARFLTDQRIPIDTRVRRLRTDRAHTMQVTVWGFAADGVNFELFALPQLALRHAPLSPGEERPMTRASISQLKALLAKNPDIQA